MTTEHGRLGQFDVVVDGEVVFARRGGLIAKLLRKPWPDPDEVVAAVRGARSADAGS